MCSIELTDENKGQGLKCKPCLRIYMSDYQRKNRKRVNESHYKWIKSNPHKHLDAVYRWRENNKEHYNEYHKIYQREWKKKKGQNDKELGTNNNTEVAGNQ